MAFKKVWSEEQKSAVIEAALEHGLTYAQVASAAGAGALPGRGAGLDPFAMPAGTIADYCGEARRRQKALEVATAAPAVALAEGIGRLVTVFAEHVAKVETEHKRGKLDVDEVGRAAKAGRAVLGLHADLEKHAARGRPRPDSGSDGDGDEAPADPERAFLDALPVE